MAISSRTGPAQGRSRSSFWLDQRTGPLPKRKPPDSAAITHEMERNYRERGFVADC
jgi:hypothetical protein